MVATRRSARSAAKEIPEAAPLPTLKAPPKRAPRKKATVEKAAPTSAPAPVEKPAAKAIPAEKPAQKAPIASKRSTRAVAAPAAIAAEAPKKTRGRKPAATAAAPPPVEAPVTVPPAHKKTTALKSRPVAESVVPPARATRGRRMNVLVSPLKTAARKRPAKKEVPAKKVEKDISEEFEGLQLETQIQADIARIAEPLSEAPQHVPEISTIAEPIQEPTPKVSAPVVLANPFITAPVFERPDATPSIREQRIVLQTPALVEYLAHTRPVLEQETSPLARVVQHCTPAPPVVEQQILLSMRQQSTSPVSKHRTPTPPISERKVISNEQQITPSGQEQHISPPVLQQQIAPITVEPQIIPPTPLVEEDRAVTPPVQENSMPLPPFIASPVKSALRSPKKLETKTPKKSVTWISAQEDFESSLLVQDGPLIGTVFFVDVTSNGTSQNHLFTGLLEDLGAQVIRDWTGNNMGLTHVLYKDGSPSTLEKVHATKGEVKCVNIGWALDCEKEKKRMDEESYLVNLGAMKILPALQPKKMANPYTPARTPSRFLLEDDMSMASIPNTPTSSEWDRSIVYDEKENSFNSSFLAKITKQGQQTCPPKPQSQPDNVRFGGGFLNKSPIKMPQTPSQLKKEPIRPWTSVKRKTENIGGITMAPAKRLKWD
ncbi:hypothetical protein K504DRAFT_462949 [Pleomassaria siparia CBS 279.74]|uniref:BRCT domain-containing protein n=1 Tax=Pleomassaria siparia CBS 279.74 TaxID=1314801 RepID=A0A6G1JTQ5_9PLEO|nr:hypothetical protein K504DRAFT_462949 [Pleomassaria siparia CBS 279.74]